MPSPATFSRDEAIDQLHDYLDDGNPIAMSNHVLDRCDERNFNALDVTRAVTRGVNDLTDPEWNVEERSWTCKTRVVIDGESYAVVIAFDTNEGRGPLVVRACTIHG